MLKALRRVEQNKGAPGIDNLKVADVFMETVEEDAYQIS